MPTIVVQPEVSPTNPASSSQESASSPAKKIAGPTLHPARKVSIGLVFAFFFVLNFLFLITSTGRVRTMDEVMPDLQAESLGARGSLAVPQAVAAHTFFGKFDRFGQPQAAYLPGQAAAALPWDVAGHYLSANLRGIPPASRDMVNDFFTVMSSATYAALAGALAFAFFLSFGLEQNTAFFAAALFTFATPLFAYSGWFYSEPLAVALLMGAVLALFGGGSEAEITSWRAAIAGLCLGALVWVRAPHVLVAGAFLLALVLSERRYRWYAAILVSTILGVAVVLLLWRNKELFGHWLDFGYPQVAEGGRDQLAFAPPFRGLFAFLLSPGKSLFLFAPAVFLAFAGVRKLWSRDRGLAWLVILGPLIYLGFYSSYSMFEGGYSYGPRYLVPGIALLCLALGAALDGASASLKRSAIFVFAAGLLINCIGLATSFLQPMVGAYYDSTYRYQLDYSPIMRQLQLLLNYATTPGPAPLGVGFDRWWITLSKVGISPNTLTAIAAIEIGGLLLSALWLIKLIRASRVPAQ
jgi:hypothetical protein